VFLSGHDPDYHATIGSNTMGAVNIVRRSLAFVRNGNDAPILFIQSNTENIALGEHADSELGLIASGYAAGSAPGENYVKVNSTQFATEDLSKYSALLIPSDHGGSLTGDDLVAINHRTADILEFVHRGGGLVAFAQDGMRVPATVEPQPTNFGFLEGIVSSTGLNQDEAEFMITPFGESLGLTLDDINRNAAHSIFTSFGGLQVVSLDAEGRVITVAGQLVPEPLSAWYMLIVLFTFGGRHRRVSSLKFTG
jgi:hypothetical protein